MKKAIYNVVLITVLAKLFGFGREILLSYYFGASSISDAYLTAQTIPGTIFQFVGTGLATSFIPIYMKIQMQEGEDAANRFTNEILTAVLFFSSIVIIFILKFAEPIIKVFASGFTEETLKTTVLFLKIGIFSLYFSTFIYVFNSYLHAHNVFAIVAFGAVPNSFMIMLAIVLGAKLNILALPIGSVLAVALQAFLLFPVMKKQHYCYKLEFRFYNTHIREIIRLMIPVTVGVSVNQINILVDRTMASQLVVGGISALLYAESIIMFIQGIFSQSIATVYYPALTERAERGEWRELKSLLNEALESMSFVLIPMTVGCIILGKGIVTILYGRGAFDVSAILMTGTVLSFYGIGIMGYGVREILSRLFYAYHNTKIPMFNSAIGMLINIGMNLTFSRVFGLKGLALATSISSIITAILLWMKLRRNSGEFLEKKSIREYGKMFLAAIIMGVIVWINYNIWPGMIGTVASVIVGSISYLILAHIFQIKVLKKAKDILCEKKNIK